MTGLGYLYEDDPYSEAGAVSADGSVVVGRSKVASGMEAYRWESGVMTGLGWPLIGLIHVAAVSDDGSVAVGWDSSGAYQEAFRWENGVVTYLGDLQGGGFDTQAESVSADGSVIAGTGTSTKGMEAFRWEDGVMTGLGFLPGPGSLDSTAYAISGNGNTIVGKCDDDLGADAFIWGAENGMRNLQEVLEYDCGLDLTGWTLNRANGISYDGLTIVGEGVGPNGHEAWVATVPEPCALSLLFFGCIGLRRRKSRLRKGLKKSLERARIAVDIAAEGLVK